MTAEASKNLDLHTHTAAYYQANPIVLICHSQRQVFKYDIARALDCSRFDRMLRTLLDSDPDFADEVAAMKNQKWVGLELAEKIVLRWVNNPAAWVRFEPFKAHPH